jgi:hypothetical protein
MGSAMLAGTLPGAAARGRRESMSQTIQYGVFLITVPNLIVIVLMIIVFGVSLFLSLPQHREK